MSDESKKRESIKQALAAVEGRMSTQLSGVNRQLRESQGKLQQLSDGLVAVQTEFVTAASLEEYRTGLAVQARACVALRACVACVRRTRARGHACMRAFEAGRTEWVVQIEQSEKVITAVSEMLQERRKGAPQFEKTLLDHTQALREMAEGKMDRSEFRSTVTLVITRTIHIADA